MPKLIRFLLHHFCNGAAFGATLVLAILYFDLLGLAPLMAGEEGGLVTALLIGQAALLGGTVAAAAAVMLLGRDGD